MQRSLIIIMVITLLVVVFAMQNNTVIHLDIWFWSVDIHTGLVLIITFTVGTSLGIISSVPRVMKRKKEIRELKEQLSTRVEQERPEDIREPSAGDEPADPEFEDVIND